MRVSLDLYHRTINEITVKIKKLESVGMSVTQLTLGFLLVGLGVLTYYFAPMSFIYQEFTLFFMILNFVLILMILGLSFLSLLLLPALQRLLLSFFLLLRPSHRPLHALISKNLESHRSRNTKTAMMFVIALSFLIFAGSIFELMGRLIVSQVEQTMGGVDLYATTFLSPMGYVDEGPIREFLEEQKKRDGAVTAYTFASTELRDLLASIDPVGQG